MNQLEIATERMAAAAGMAEVLAAACAAFLTMLPVIQDHQDPASSWFDAFAMAGAAAAAGRLAVFAAPSLPGSSRSLQPAPPDPGVGGAEQVAADLATLCGLIAEQLYRVALTAADAADRHACSRASHHAREAGQWLSGEAAP